MVRPSSDPIDSRTFAKRVASPQVSLRYAVEAVTVLQWSRLSDRIGRNPFFFLASWAQSPAEASSSFRVLHGRLHSSVDLPPVILNGRSCGPVVLRNDSRLIES